MSLHQAYQPLLDALKKRLAIISDHSLRDADPAAHLEQLKSVSESILTLQAQLAEKSSIPPRLRHFLDQCSYDKALQYLEEELEP